MRLSDVPRQFTMIVRDGEFTNLGFISHQSESMLTFIEHEDFIKRIVQAKNITCVITTPDLVSRIPECFGCALAESPRDAFFQLHDYLARKTNFYWESFASSIDPTAKVHPRAYIAEANVRIGAGVIIEPNATILERCIIGDNVIIRSGVILGSEGFQFKRTSIDITPVIHSGGVLIEDGVELQANTTIDRALFGGYTRIGVRTKIADLVHVAHNVSIGCRCLIGAHVTINGSSIIGDDVWIGPGAIISNDLTIGDRASITLGSVVIHDVAPEQRVSGYYAVDHRQFREWFMRWFPEVQ